MRAIIISLFLWYVFSSSDNSVCNKGGIAFEIAQGMSISSGDVRCVGASNMTLECNQSLVNIPPKPRLHWFHMKVVCANCDRNNCKYMWEGGGVGGRKTLLTITFTNMWRKRNLFSVSFIVWCLEAWKTRWLDWQRNNKKCSVMSFTRPTQCPPSCMTFLSLRIFSHLLPNSLSFLTSFTSQIFF